MVRCIAGADHHDTGVIELEGKPLSLRSPAAAIEAGIVMVPEDRKGQGLNLGLSSAVNILLPWEASMGRRKLITNKMLHRAATKAREDFDIRGSIDLPVLRLSGWQPAEGPAGQMAGPRAKGAHPGRTHPRRRRGRQDGDLRDHPQVRRARASR